MEIIRFILLFIVFFGFVIFIMSPIFSDKVLEKIIDLYGYFFISKEVFLEGSVSTKKYSFGMKNPFISSEYNDFIIPTTEYYLYLSNEGKKYTIRIDSSKLFDKLSKMEGEIIFILCKKFPYESKYVVSEPELLEFQ